MIQQDKKIKNSEEFFFYRVFFFMIWIGVSFYGQAQEKPRPTFEIGTDPLAYLWRGYSAHAAVTYGAGAV